MKKRSCEQKGISKKCLHKTSIHLNGNTFESHPVDTHHPECAQHIMAILQDIQLALQKNSVTTDSQLSEWVNIVDAFGNIWCKTHLARLLVQKKHGDTYWNHIVFKWLLDSARENSWWTPELLQLCLFGWPFTFLKSDILFQALELSPQKIIQGFINVLKQKSELKTFVPTPFVSRVIDIARTLYPNDRILFARFLRIVRGGEARWIKEIFEWLDDFEVTQEKYVIALLQELILGWPVILGILISTHNERENLAYTPSNHSLFLLRKFFSHETIKHSFETA